MSLHHCFDINMQVENAIDDSRTVRAEKIKGFYVSILVINLKIKGFIPSGAGSIRLHVDTEACTPETDLHGPISIQQEGKTLLCCRFGRSSQF